MQATQATSGRSLTESRQRLGAPRQLLVEHVVEQLRPAVVRCTRVLPVARHPASIGTHARRVGAVHQPRRRSAATSLPSSDGITSDTASRSASEDLRTVAKTFPCKVRCIFWDQERAFVDRPMTGVHRGRVDRIVASGRAQARPTGGGRGDPASAAARLSAYDDLPLRRAPLSATHHRHAPAPSRRSRRRRPTRPTTGKRRNETVIPTNPRPGQPTTRTVAAACSSLGLNLRLCRIASGLNRRSRGTRRGASEWPHPSHQAKPDESVSQMPPVMLLDQYEMP